MLSLLLVKLGHSDTIRFTLPINAKSLCAGSLGSASSRWFDEATGYQDARSRDALAKILEAFVTKELKKWISTFPADYYKELFRLQGWAFPTLAKDKNKRPAMAGKITNDIVYDRLAPGVKDELHRLTPRDEKGRLKQKLFQRLTSDVGSPRLKEHLASVVALMKASDDWQQFMRSLNRALPKWSDNLSFKFED